MRCAAGHEPVSQSYTKTTRQCKVSFNCNYCVGCPYQGQCRPKIDGWNATFITSKNASNRAKSQRYMQSEEFSNYAKLRNGVETVPANIRKNYRLDKLPRGKQRAKFFFGSKIAALNFRKLFGFRKGLVMECGRTEALRCGSSSAYARMGRCFAIGRSEAAGTSKADTIIFSPAAT